MLQTTENELWKTARLTSFQKPQCNLIQSHSSLGSSHWSIQGSFCICCAAYTFFWHFEHGVIFMFHSVWWQFWLNTFVTHPVSSFNQCRLILTSGRSRGGAHPRPPLFLDQIEAQRAENFFSKTPPPPLISRCGSSTANCNVTKDPKYILQLWEQDSKRVPFLVFSYMKLWKGRDFTSCSI